MAASGGYIKIERKILEWRWYNDCSTKLLFLHCVLMANWKEGHWKGLTISRGQFVTSLPKLSRETGLSIQQLRTALEHLKSTGEITETSAPKYRIITVQNYEKYQAVTERATDNQQTTNSNSNRQPTVIEEIKNNKARKKKEKESGYAASRPPGAKVKGTDTSTYTAADDDDDDGIVLTGDYIDDYYARRNARMRGR